MNILCTLCARGGSVGVKNKNIRSLLGKPLIAHSILQAKETKLFDTIVVSSDSKKICQVAMQWGVTQVIDRPAEMASSTAPKIPVIQHALLEAERVQGKKFDFIVDLDATAPLRTVDDIINSFNLLVDHHQATNLVTACSARKSPYFNMLEIQENGFVQLAKKLDNLIHRRQDSPRCYDMNASIYVWRRDALLNSQTAIMDRTLLYIMPEERSIDIDTPVDWMLVKLLAKKRQDLYP